jgi:TrmH family RNA methyltransferase
MPKYRHYKKDDRSSYAMGTYPTIDLLKFAPQHVQFVAINATALESEGVQEVIRLCDEKQIRYELADRMIERIAPKENTYCVGVFRKFEAPLQHNTNHVVLVEPRDMGNVGTIIRSMVGFGVQDLAIVRPAADIFDPRVVRSAMGALFQLRFQYFENYYEYQGKFPDQHLYPFMLDGQARLGETSFEPPWSLIFGNEGQGLPPDFQHIGTSVTIPHSDTIDSLNLSIATGIALWEAQKAG